jgi:hypothetical protein
LLLAARTTDTRVNAVGTTQPQTAAIKNSAEQARAKRDQQREGERREQRGAFARHAG